MTQTLSALTALLTALSGLLGIAVALVPVMRLWVTTRKIKGRRSTSTPLPPELSTPDSSVALEPPRAAYSVDQTR